MRRPHEGPQAACPLFGVGSQGLQEQEDGMGSLESLHTTFVLAYHGCEEEVGKKLIADGGPIRLSNTGKEWLGPGFYVWESDPVRALEWATGKKKIKKPYVVGVVLDLGHCLDLMSRESLEALREAYEMLKDTSENVDFPDDDCDENDYIIANITASRLDCEVIKYLHENTKRSEERKEFDTVRGLFLDGGELYDGSRFHKKTHVQIAVITDVCIKGFFKVRDPKLSIGVNP